MATTDGPVEGVPGWADVMLPDLAAGKRFYGELFGWTFGEPGPAGQGAYTQALLGGRRVAALARKPDGRFPSAWTLYLATRDVSAALRRIRAAGGQVVMEPTPLDRREDLATVATATDPGGAVFGLWQPGRHTGFEVRVEAGSFVWYEVHTWERAAVETFYVDVFDYGMTSLPTESDEGGDGDSGRGEPSAPPVDASGSLSGGPDEPAASGGQRPAGVDEVPGETGLVLWTPPGQPVDEEHAVGGCAVFDARQPTELPAHYLLFFAVTDCDEAVRSTLRLGGRVRTEPRTTRFGRFARLVDNQGAEFAVLDVETVDETAARW